MSSCACLGVAGSLLLGCSWRFSHWFPQAHWPRTQSARCYALYAGACAIIRQRGGLVAKHGDPPAAAPLDLLHIACLVATCAFELLPCDVRMGVRPAWLVGSSAHRSALLRVRLSMHSHLRYHISPTLAIRRLCLGRCLRLSWNTAVSDISSRLITTARLTLHSKPGSASAGLPIFTFLPYRS